MGWCTTSDLDRFAAAAGGYLRSRAAENTLLLSATLAVRSGSHTPVVGQPSGPGAAANGADGDSEMLFGWWEPPDGSGARGAFFHDPAAPLLIAGRVPEMAAALAGTLSKLGRHVSGVDAPIEAADAFAAAWSQRAHSSIRVHRQCRVYRLTAASADAVGTGGTGVGAGGSTGAASPGGLPGGWPPPQTPGLAGRLRVMTIADRALLIDWLSAYGIEVGERISSPKDMADDLISYGGAVLWEIPRRPFRIKEAAHYLVSPQHREAVQQSEPAYQPAALAAVARPVAGTVRISMVYTPPERRRSGHAAAATLMTSRAILAGSVPCSTVTGPEVNSEVVLIADGNRPDRQVTRLGFQLVGERAVLRFGPSTGPLPKLRSSNRPMPRLPTGPLPRLRR